MIFEVQGKTENYIKLERDYEGIEFLGKKQLQCTSAVFCPYSAKIIFFLKPGGRELVEYEIQLEHLEMKAVNNISRAYIKIVFARKIEFHIANTFLQTFLLILVGYMSLYFDIEDFTDRIMVTLTSMLVVATLLSAIQSVC